MQLVVGLGNPGREYAGTRHNVGFEVLAELARRFAGGPARRKFDSELIEVLCGTERLLLLAPQTYMNLSGKAVRQAADFYQLSLKDILVVCDDLNLPTGKLRLRTEGSAGGQKGLQDIIRHLGTTDVPRLRIGIDRPAGGRPATDYVLGRFSSSEREVMDAAVQAAAGAVEMWSREGVAAAMNRYNVASSGESGG